MNSDLSVLMEFCIASLCWRLYFAAKTIEMIAKFNLKITKMWKIAIVFTEIVENVLRDEIFAISLQRQNKISLQNASR